MATKESQSDHPSWFTTKSIKPNLFLTTENHFFEDNRSNIWLLRGSARDLIIDCGLGVCNLKKHLENLNLLSQDRECIVLCSHSHFDHSGGAHHFENDSKILIHQDDHDGLQQGRQLETLNYVQATNFFQKPYDGFSPREYRVPATKCDSIMDGHTIDLGGGEEVIVMHVPGHTQGSIACYHPKEKALFTGDFVYECEHGRNFCDWLPTSSVHDYLRSANRMLDWLGDHEIDQIYPGHFQTFNGKIRMRELLEQYIKSRENWYKRLTATCLKTLTKGYFCSGCSRLFPI